MRQREADKELPMHMAAAQKGLRDAIETKDERKICEAQIHLANVQECMISAGMSGRLHTP